MDMFQGKKKINIVFLGGSITEGAGASQQENCFANRTGEWLKEQYGEKVLTYYNKGIGGTPSEYGLYRFDRDVAVYEPDMVFVEFAVNDGGRDTRKYVEGIVRKLIELPSKPYVVFLYTTNETYTTSTTYFEEVANYYSIPEIYLKDALKNHLEGKNAREAGYLKDSVHPSDKGYEIYFEEMKRCLAESNYYRVPQNRKERLVSESFEPSMRFLVSQDTVLSGTWKLGGEGQRKYIVGGKGDFLTFEFVGNILAFEHGLHQDSAVYEVYVDGEKIGEGDPWYRDFTTNQLVLGFTATNLSSGSHKVKVVVKASEKEERSDKQILLYNILYGSSRND